MPFPVKAFVVLPIVVIEYFNLVESITVLFVCYTSYITICFGVFLSFLKILLCKYRSNFTNLYTPAKNIF